MQAGMIRTAALCAALLVPATGHAQITLPQVQLPDVPIVQAPIDVNRTVNGVLGAANPEQLRELRRLRIRNLLRTNRAVLEADPRGAPVIRSEVVALSPTAAALQQAQAAGFEVARTRTLDGLDATVVVLRAPPRMSTRRALRELQRADPQGVYDFNHLYMESGDVILSVRPEPVEEFRAGSADAKSVSTGSTRTDNVNLPPGHATSASPSELAPQARVGLIDGGIDRSHAAFGRNAIHAYGCQSEMPSAHGTAVASLIAGYAPDFHGAAPGAALYVADVYCGAATGGAVDAVADAFAWLSREQVPIINVSLVGPANRMLEQIVRIVIARGSIVVAAVGNDGPSAPPLYPAAYAGVVAVTGVDAKRRVLFEACRGPHVAFAAPGADMPAATTPQAQGPAYVLVRGTSFAAPLIAGLLATHLQQPDKANAGAAIAALATQAIDLGARGQDKVYGRGLVGEELRMREDLTRLGAKSRDE